MRPVIEIKLHLKSGMTVHLSATDDSGYMSTLLTESEVKSVEVISTKTEIKTLVHQHFSV
jgi:hypothetical protein